MSSGSSDGPRVHRLQEVNVTIMPPDVCKQYYLGRLRPSMFCAGKDEGGADACQVRPRCLSSVQRPVSSCCLVLFCQIIMPSCLFCFTCVVYNTVLSGSQGDSGGPLSCFMGSRYKLAGLVSWGVGCGRARRPGVYTKIEQHFEWMSAVMSKFECFSVEEMFFSEGSFHPQMIRTAHMQRTSTLKVGLNEIC